MKIVLLLANTEVPLLNQVIACIKDVLADLDVGVETVLLKDLPYFQNKKEPIMEALAKQIAGAKGVIAIANVHLAGMHGAMHSFFEHMALYDEVVVGKPMVAVTYTDYTGEVEAANQMLRLWSVLGGVGGSNLSFHHKIHFEEVQMLVERSIEDFYRLLKQQRKAIYSTDRALYLLLTERKEAPQEFVPLQMPSVHTVIEQPIKVEESLPKVIKDDEPDDELMEITKLLRQQIQKQERHTEGVTKSTNVGERIEVLDTGVYQRLSTMGKVNPLSAIPHSFVAQHNKELSLCVQYTIEDTKQQGAIVIKDGDCSYVEGTIEVVDIDILVNNAILNEILYKKLTYQKAFMVGKMKVKGNFALLAKLDQIFKAL